MSRQSTVPPTPPHLPPSNVAPPSAAAAVTAAATPIPFDHERIRYDLRECSDFVWEVEELRDSQYRIAQVMFDPNLPNQIVAVYPTGSGKSHVIRVIGAMHRGICLIFIPLLTLSADVMAKFDSACQLYGSVRSYHLDELIDNNKEKYDQVLQRCKELPRSTDSTVFIFLSPQHLCKCANAREIFVGCSAYGTLRTVVMDEVHLHVQHGLSFRPTGFDIHPVQ